MKQLALGTKAYFPYTTGVMVEELKIVCACLDETSEIYYKVSGHGGNFTFIEETNTIETEYKGTVLYLNKEDAKEIVVEHVVKKLRDLG